jgi:hypothetical protein
MSEQTPGPWAFDEGTGGVFSGMSGSGEVRTAVTLVATVRMVSALGESASPAERRANAALITAAPRVD